jgi:predicted phage tail protein
MKVFVIKDFNEPPYTFETKLDNIRDVLNHLACLQSKEYMEEIIDNYYSFVLVDSEVTERSLALPSQMVFTPIIDYDTLVIVKNVAGELPLIPIAIGIASSIAATAAFDALLVAGYAAWIAYSAYAAITIAGMAASFLVSQAIAPHPTVVGDPAKGISLNSDLFGQAAITYEQGGSVPLIYGDTFCSGTLICSSVTTVQG